jgi:rRNA N6-adenosine-methyltransferase METTL5
MCMQVDLMQCDVATLPLRQGVTADTVVMNPPFGTRTRGADMAFLRAAFAVSHTALENEVCQACRHPRPYGDNQSV